MGIERASVYSGGSDSSDYTVVERRIVTEEKKVTTLPSTQNSAFMVLPAGTNVQNIQGLQNIQMSHMVSRDLKTLIVEFEWRNVFTGVS